MIPSLIIRPKRKYGTKVGRKSSSWTPVGSERLSMTMIFSSVDSSGFKTRRTRKANGTRSLSSWTLISGMGIIVTQRLRNKGVGEAKGHHSVEVLSEVAPLTNHCKSPICCSHSFIQHPFPQRNHANTVFFQFLIVGNDDFRRKGGFYGGKARELALAVAVGQFVTRLKGMQRPIP